MNITFEYNEESCEWEFEYKGTIYSEDTFIDAATQYNRLVFEAA